MNFTKLIWYEPWLAPIALNIKNTVETESVETVAITPDGKILYYNKKFWKKLKKNERLAVQIHELLHIVNRHSLRENGRNHDVWNLACDTVINYQIRVSGYQMPAGTVWGENDTAENIYEELINYIKFESKKFKQKSAYSGEAYKIDRNNPVLKNLLYGDLLAKTEDGKKENLCSETEEAVESSIHLAGHGTTELSRMFSPHIVRGNWKEVLSNMTKSITGDDLDYLSYEFDEFGICEDILSKKPRPRICVLVDESSSITDELYEKFLGELKKISRFAEVYASGFTNKTELNAVPIKNYQRKMCGGTDVRICYTQACNENFDGIVILTDGCLKFPVIEPKPTIWAMPCSHGRKKEVIIGKD